MPALDDAGDMVSSSSDRCLGVKEDVLMPTAVARSRSRCLFDKVLTSAM